MNPLKTLVPVNASRNKVVDQQMDLLVFCWRRTQPQQSIGRVYLPQIRPHPISPSLPEAQRWSGHLSNSLVPFYTTLKPTFGYRFSWETDHKRRAIGIDAREPCSGGVISNAK
ncbi:unnamed protein product [Lota lota]